MENGTMPGWWSKHKILEEGNGDPKPPPRQRAEVEAMRDVAKAMRDGFSSQHRFTVTVKEYADKIFEGVNLLSGRTGDLERHLARLSQRVMQLESQHEACASNVNVRPLVDKVERPTRTISGNNNCIPYPAGWPRYVNGCGTPCDMLQGPCICGATHSLTEWQIQLPGGTS